MEKKIISQKEALKELGLRIKKYWYLLACSIMLAVVYVVLSLYIPKLIGFGTDKIIAAGKVNFDGLKEVVFSIFICAVVAGIAQWVMGLCNNRITFHVIRDVRQEAFTRIQRLPVSYIDSKSSGDIVNSVITDVDQLADGLLMGFSNLFTGVITILFTLIFMLQTNWKIALVVILITPVSFFVASFIARRTYSMFRKQSEIRGEQTALVDEVLSGIKVVQAFGQEEKTISQFDDINDRLNVVNVKATFYSSITNPSTRFVNNLVYAGVAISGGLEAILTRGITVGGLTCILSYANQYTKPFNEISGVITELQNALACSARVFSLIKEITVEDVEENESTVIKSVSGKVDIENVSFSYDPDKQLIEDLNLHVEPGQRIAIVGPTGCGKTTIINLLMRFYDVKSGIISVDDRNIKDITRKSLRRSYGMVLQETWLRNATIAENIAMAKPEASREEIIEAARASHAHSFIKRLPEGYDTVIGEDGGNLSQGQKQLLCIARVMLALPPMLILDEATSSIDTRTEIKIQRAFHKMMEGRTTFIVAHRLSTIKEADTILVMKAGKIIEQGNHEELLRKKGFYYQLYNS
ncbi:ABC transporter ATP-binding protein [uncultured Eubacterium sp.]|uniref:ABC transporter ATP-binding protein n=1 Tax=uncultured Eubacterium sp. TaxID=165185 RepID=UPI002670D7CB|nr:ABC transporter ATP-binding protein [uncultured Eubacterium sp.]